MKIAIVKLSALGDIVHASIVLQFIIKFMPKAQISWFADEKFSEVIDGADGLYETIKLPLKEKNYKKSYEIIKKYSNTFDIVIDLQGLIKSAIVSRMLSKNCVGFDKTSIKEPQASLLYGKKLRCSYNKNIIVRNLNLISWALGFSYTKDEILQKKPCLKEDKFKLDLTKKTILIAPFSSDESKNYTKFKEVINALDEYEIFVCYGNEQEKQRAKTLIKDTKAKLLKKLNIKKMIYFISQCSLTIGNDSGITHIAWAQNRPSITLFGNRPSYRNVYKSPINLVIDTGKKINATKINKNDFCINQIPPSEVVLRAKELLSAK